MLRFLVTRSSDDNDDLFGETENLPPGLAAGPSRNQLPANCFHNSMMLTAHAHLHISTASLHECDATDSAREVFLWEIDFAFVTHHQSRLWRIISPVNCKQTSKRMERLKQDYVKLRNFLDWKCVNDVNRFPSLLIRFAARLSCLASVVSSCWILFNSLSINKIFTSVLRK